MNEFTGFLSDVKEEISRKDAKEQRKSEPRAIATGTNVRTHKLAVTPLSNAIKKTLDFELKTQRSLRGTIMTGEMFAPVLKEQVEKLNKILGSEFHVLAVPNTYFGGDVSVAGLLSGQDFLAVKDKIKGDFVIIPEHVIKSDEPILIDGMQFDELKAKYPVPIYAMDLKDYVWEFLQS